MQQNYITDTVPMDKGYTSKFEQILSFFSLEKFKFSAPKVAVIRLQGIIGGGSSFKSGLTIENMNPLIEEAFKIDKLDALCLIINSPGGSPVQSELIANRIIELAKEKEVKIYTFIEDVAASGGYWLACIGDEIYASRSSIVGSIGVIAASFGFHEALEKLGIERRVYIEGRNKSLLDPFQPENKDAVKIIKKIQKQIHEHFIDYVKLRRRNRITQNDDIIYNGEVWSGQTALDFGLIDGIDNFYSFINKKYGDNVKLKFITAKQSWFKNKFKLLGINNIDTIKSSAAATVDYAIEKLKAEAIYNRFNIR